MNIYESIRRKYCILIFLFVMCSMKLIANKGYDEFIYEPIIDLHSGYQENIEFVKTLQNYSADLFGESITANEIDSIIQTIKEELQAIPSQKIKLTDLIHLYWTKLLYKAAETDAHFSITIPHYFAIEGIEIKPEDINVLPFTLWLNNNSAFVEWSYDKQFKTGDKIISINNIPVEKFIEYYPSPRTYVNGRQLQTFYYFAYAKEYNIRFERTGEIKSTLSRGKPMDKPYYEPEQAQAIAYRQYNAGYFNIIDFQAGAGERAEKMSLFIDSLQHLGINNLIIDIRNNPGGDSRNIADFFSIMSDKDSYLSFGKSLMRVSDPIIELLKKFLPEDMIAQFDLDNNRGNIIDISVLDDIGNTNVLDNTKYKKGMNYYILMGEKTGSAAACFARLAQINNIATLVGESTLPNPDNHGNAFLVMWNNSPHFGVYLSSSKFEFKGEDKTINGRIVPDIEIPFTIVNNNANDPQLDKLLEIIYAKK